MSRKGWNILQCDCCGKQRDWSDGRDKFYWFSLRSWNGGKEYHCCSSKCGYKLVHKMVDIEGLSKYIDTFNR